MSHRVRINDPFGVPIDSANLSQLLLSETRQKKSILGLFSSTHSFDIVLGIQKK